MVTDRLLLWPSFGIAASHPRSSASGGLMGQARAICSPQACKRKARWWCDCGLQLASEIQRAMQSHRHLSAHHSAPSSQVVHDLQAMFQPVESRINRGHLLQLQQVGFPPRFSSPLPSSSLLLAAWHLSSNLAPPTGSPASCGTRATPG